MLKKIYFSAILILLCALPKSSFASEESNFEENAYNLPSKPNELFPEKPVSFTIDQEKIKKLFFLLGIKNNQAILGVKSS